jgi:putative phosphonate catabolism associated alcohol dehydrogenase
VSDVEGSIRVNSKGISHSRAAVFEGVGQQLAIRQVAIPELESDEILVRVICCTICGSDLHTFTGRRPGPVPGVLGHEIIGRIESLPPAPVEDLSGNLLSVGDRITWSVATSCGNCPRCNGGIPQKCDSLFKYGHESFAANPLSGGLADYCVLKTGTAIVRLPDSLVDRVGCPANCATATVAAAYRRAGDCRGKRVLIFGAGMLGLTASAFACATMAKEVVVCDVDSKRRQRATAFGATAVATAVTDDAFDCVFEMSGSPQAVESAIQAASIGATIVLVGSVSPSRSVSFDPERIVRRLLSIQGVHNYRPDDLITAVNFLTTHGRQFPFEGLVEQSFALDDAQQAFEYAIASRPIRVAVIP